MKKLPIEWTKIFEIRCRSKSGRGITPEELRLCERAIAEDPERYSRMDRDVFNATKPFGA